MRFLFLLFCAVIAQNSLAFASFDHGIVTIYPQNGPPVAFSVEIARTQEQRARGLMYRKTLDLRAGMLFVFEGEQMRFMWMKNTKLPLDMIFANANAVVVHVHENAVPQSLAIINSGQLTKYVLELNAGEIKRFHIGPGARMKISKKEAIPPQR